MLTYRAGPEVLGLSVELGADYQGQHNLQRRFDTIARVPQGPPVRDDDFTFNVAGSYLQARLRPIDALELVGALRADALWGQLHDRLADERYELNDFGVIWQPKLSAAWTSARRSATASTSSSRSHRFSGSRSGRPTLLRSRSRTSPEGEKKERNGATDG